MKKRSILITTVILAMALVFTLASCGGGAGGDTKVIADEWHRTLTQYGRYKKNAADPEHTGFIAKIGERTITLSGGDFGTVTLSGVHTEGGGSITLSTPGKWTYVYKGDTKIGFMVTATISGVIWYDLYIGKQATDKKAAVETNLGITLDLTGVPEYPSFMVQETY